MPVFRRALRVKVAGDSPPDEGSHREARCFDPHFPRRFQPQLFLGFTVGRARAPCGATPHPALRATFSRKPEKGFAVVRDWMRSRGR